MNPSVAVTYQLDNAKPNEKKGWFLIKYADFCYGDKGGDSVGSLADAKKKVLEKPKTSCKAY